MNILHLADLHIGKKVLGFSMISEQEVMVDFILDLVDREGIDCVLIAGDIYDRKIVAKEGLLLYNRLLVSLVLDRNVPVIAISGNHDSRERLEAGNLLTESVGYYVEGVLKDPVRCVTLEKDGEIVDFYLIPYADILEGRILYDEDEILTYEDVMVRTMETITVNPNHFNVALVHGYIVGDATSYIEQEKIESQKPLSIGGKEYISSHVLAGFDYVALGHLHRAQKVTPIMRYAGSPLKYSFSEETHQKSFTVIRTKPDHSLEFSLHTFRSQRDFRTIRGYFDEVVAMAITDDQTEDYIRLELLDEQLVKDGMKRIKKYYPNTMSIHYPEKKVATGPYRGESDTRQKSLSELFVDFYEFKQGHPPTTREVRLVNQLLDGGVDD